MKKIVSIIVFAATLFVAMPAEAQIKFGVKGGLNITDMSINKDVFDTSNQTGFFIGPTAKFTLPLVGLGIDAAALYDQRKADLKGSGETIKQQSINIPINLRYSIGLGSFAAVYLAAGPQFGFNIGDNDLKLGDTNWEWKSSTLSVNVGAGVTILKHLEAGANYNIVCGKSGEATVMDGVESFVKDGRNNAWQIYVAYYF